MTEHAFFDVSQIDLTEFKSQVEQSLDASTLRFTDKVEKNIPIYDIASMGDALISQPERKALLSEWADILAHKSGVLVLANAYADTAIIDQVTDIYLQIIADEKAKSGGGADHFAAAGANDRIWNSLQKLGEADPEAFVRYFANTSIAGVCEAWLGPAYQMTAQINLVRPGGAAQQAHRDYHLGFQTNDMAASFPAHVHDLSPVMTLQGGVAHCDMTVESGPTKLLPFSQLYRRGYLAYRDAAFSTYFEENYVQLPLNKGDAIFFNPALFHAAGSNHSKDIARMVNLFQVSSAFGRAMETVDRTKLCKLTYPAYLNTKSDLSEAERAAAIACTAEGYSFPTNLDNDPPVGGLAPKTQAHILADAVASGMAPSDFEAELDALDQRKLA